MVGKPRHSLAGVADIASGDAVVADHAVLLEIVHGTGFIEAGGGEVVLEAVGFQWVIVDLFPWLF